MRQESQGHGSHDGTVQEIRREERHDPCYTIQQLRIRSIFVCERYAGPFDPTQHKVHITINDHRASDADVRFN